MASIKVNANEQNKYAEKLSQCLTLLLSESLVISVWFE